MVRWKLRGDRCCCGGGEGERGREKSTTYTIFDLIFSLPLCLERVKAEEGVVEFRHEERERTWLLLRARRANPVFRIK